MCVCVLCVLCVCCVCDQDVYRICKTESKSRESRTPIRALNGHAHLRVCVAQLRISLFFGSAKVMYPYALHEMEDRDMSREGRQPGRVQAPPTRAAAGRDPHT